METVPMWLFDPRSSRRWGRCAPVIVAICATVARAAGPGFSAGLGGRRQDYAASVASDAAGNPYVAGLTYSSDFPVTPGAFQTKLGSPANADRKSTRLNSSHLGIS